MISNPAIIKSPLINMHQPCSCGREEKNGLMEINKVSKFYTDNKLILQIIVESTKII